MAKPSEKVNKPEALKRIGDYVKIGAGDRLEGEKVDIGKILGEDIVLKDYNIVQGDAKYAKKDADGNKVDSEFAVIQFTMPDAPKELLTTSCGGGVVVRALKEMPKSYLPVIVMITKKKNKAGTGTYYAIE